MGVPHLWPGSRPTQINYFMSKNICHKINKRISVKNAGVRAELINHSGFVRHTRTDSSEEKVRLERQKVKKLGNGVTSNSNDFLKVPSGQIGSA